MTINKTELKYIIGVVLFSLLLFGIVIPKLINNGIEQTSPYFQFLIFNIAIFVFLQFFLKAATGGNGRINISGALGIICLFMALDIMVPPLMVSTSGELLTGVTLSASSSDYIMGLIGQTLGLHGIMVFFFTYVLAPTVLLIFAAKLLPNFVRKI